MVKTGYTITITTSTMPTIYKSDVFFFSFGMFHDGEGNYCSPSAGKLMSPTLVSKDGQFHWSICSKAYLMRFLK
jgi:hypothetical protein